MSFSEYSEAHIPKFSQHGYKKNLETNLLEFCHLLKHVWQENRKLLPQSFSATVARLQNISEAFNVTHVTL